MQYNLKKIQEDHEFVKVHKTPNMYLQLSDLILLPKTETIKGVANL